MEATWIVVAVIAGIAALVGWVSRNRLATEMEALQRKFDGAKADATAAQREAERRIEETKERMEELVGSREKLREARRRLHDAQEETRKAKELATARAEEALEVETQLGRLREENARLDAELRKLQEAPKGRGREPVAREPVRAPAAPADPEVFVDARLQEAARRVEEAQRRQAEADRLADDARARAAEARKQAEDAKNELRRTKGRVEANHRVYLVTKGEADLWKAKFGALEEKWNELWRELEGIGWKPREPREGGGASEGGDRRRSRPRRGERRQRSAASDAPVTGAEAGPNTDADTTDARVVDSASAAATPEAQPAAMADSTPSGEGGWIPEPTAEESVAEVVADEARVASEPAVVEPVSAEVVAAAESATAEQAPAEDSGAIAAVEDSVELDKASGAS